MWIFEEPSLLWDDKRKKKHWLCFSKCFILVFIILRHHTLFKQSSIIRPLCCFPFSEGHILLFCLGLPQKLKNNRSMYCLQSFYVSKSFSPLLSIISTSLTIFHFIFGFIFVTLLSECPCHFTCTLKCQCPNLA